MKILELEHIYKSFGGVKVADDLNLEINSGKTYAVVGPNGAGKTSLFNIITGYIHPERGSIKFLGDDITRLQTYQVAVKGISRAFQSVNVFENLTVFQNVKIGRICCQRLGMNFLTNADNLSETNDETWDVLERTMLTSVSDSLPKLLPHGIRKRLELAIALAFKSRLLLLDEPTAGMNRDESFEIMNLIRKIQNEYQTDICFVEHDLDIVYEYADIIYVMSEGRVVTMGSPSEINNSEIVKKVFTG